MNGRGSLVESGEARGEQYSLAKILGIWALAAAPMGILGWIFFPLLAPDAGSDPLRSGVTRLERVMNLGEKRIEMRISRSAWFARDLCFPHS